MLLGTRPLASKDGQCDPGLDVPVFPGRLGTVNVAGLAIVVPVLAGLASVILSVVAAVFAASKAVGLAIVVMVVAIAVTVIVDLAFAVQLDAKPVLVASGTVAIAIVVKAVAEPASEGPGAGEVERAV